MSSAQVGAILRHIRQLATAQHDQEVPDAQFLERFVLHQDEDAFAALYRAPLVLCGLEGKSLEEGARLLGWAKGAIKWRLQRSRELLRARLRRRGLELSAGLFATVLSTSVASAKVPATLAASTMKAALVLAAGKEPVAGLISAKVAALVKGATPTMFYTKAKIATVLLLAMGLAATAFGVARHQAAAADQPAAKQNQAAKSQDEGDQQAPTPRLKPEVKDTIEVNGRVLGPDGKPFEGAKLYLGYYSPKEMTYPIRATSGTDGRFAFRFFKSELDKTFSDEPSSQVMAVAKGYGCDWADVVPGSKDQELTLRLVEDVPISGRVLDQDGKPIPGAKVRVQDTRVYPGETLKAELEDIRKGGVGTRWAKGWGGPLPGHPKTLSTGADGRFRLAGFGRERLVLLHIEGPAIHHTTVRVMTRASETVIGANPQRQVRIYGAAFDYLALAARPIRGVVRDKETGKPVAGVQISSIFTTHATQTDREGRYELLGCPKSKEYAVSVRPAPNQPYFASGFNFADAPGLTPLTADIELVRGISLRGRVTDKATGKAVAKARVHYYAVFPNPYGRELGRNFDGSGASSGWTGPDGSFALVVLPGPGVIGATAPSRDAYMPALITPKEMKEFFKDSKHWTDTGNSEHSLMTAAGGNAASFIVQESFDALVLIEPIEKTEALQQDLALRRARTLKGSVVGPDGKPLAGVSVYGLALNETFTPQTLKTDAFIVTGLNPKRTRQLLFYHKEKKLGFFKDIPGNEPEPLTVKLQPCGSATGRVVDKDGQPLANLALNFNRYLLHGPGGAEAKTDKDGRFRVEDLVPGQKYMLEPANRAPQVRITAALVVEAGKTKDLGDVTIESNP